MYNKRPLLRTYFSMEEEYEKEKDTRNEEEKRKMEKIYLMTALFFAGATLLLVKGLMQRWLE